MLKTICTGFVLALFAMSGVSAPKTMERSSNETVNLDSASACYYYVKPATCASHSECKWVGSCVPR